MVIDGNTRAGDDERYMLEAVKEAARAAEEGEVPVGAVIVKDGEVIATGANRVVPNSDPTAHAEVMAIRNACKKLGTFQLTGCTLYS